MDLLRLKALLKDSQEAVVLVIGERGMGKSRLLASLEIEGAAVTHRVRINPAEAKLSQSGLSTLLASLQEPEAMQLSARLLSLDNRGADPVARTTELLTLFRMPSRPPTVLMIDDLDLMDSTSQSIIAMVASRLGGGHFTIVATASEVPHGPLGSLPKFRLEPITFAASMQLLREPSLPTMNEAVQRIVVEQSNGNPGALVRNARALTEDQLEGNTPIAIPFRVSRSSSNAASRLLTTAAASRRVLLAQLSCAMLTNADAMMQSTALATDVLDDFLADGTVAREGRYIRIRDPLLRSRMYWSLGAATRAEYHATAARTQANEPGLVAWHTSWLTPTAVSSEELLTWAIRFARAGLAGQAIELAERALAVAGKPLKISLALFQLAHVMFLHGELAHAARYVRLARRTTTAPRYSQGQATLRAWIEFMGSHQLATADVDSCMNVTGTDDPRLSADALASFSIFHAERWETVAAHAALSRAKQVSHGSTGTGEIVNLADMFNSSVEGHADPTVAMLDRVTNGGIAATPPGHLVLLGRALTYAERYSEARRIFKTILSLEPAPSALWLETANYALADNEILSGNQFEAVAAIAKLVKNGMDAQLHRNAHRLLSAWYWLALDDRDEASTAVAECHRSFASGDNPALAARLEAYQGHFALVQENLDEAIPFLRSAASFASRLQLPTLLRYQVDLIDTYVSAGRHPEAVAEFQDFQARTKPYRSRYTMLLAARAQALVAHGEPSLAAFQKALKLWSSGDPSFELARTHLNFGDRLASLGNFHGAAEQRLAARLIFSQLGATLWARRAGHAVQADATVPEHPLMSALSWEERSVAELVCRGWRNKEIANELFVSLRTVEVRLTRIYHKTNVRSRSQLIAILSNRSDSSTTIQ